MPGSSPSLGAEPASQDYSYGGEDDAPAGGGGLVEHASSEDAEDDDGAAAPVALASSPSAAPPAAAAATATEGADRRGAGAGGSGWDNGDDGDDDDDAAAREAQGYGGPLHLRGMDDRIEDRLKVFENEVARRLLIVIVNLDVAPLSDGTEKLFGFQEIPKRFQRILADRIKIVPVPNVGVFLDVFGLQQLVCEQVLLFRQVFVEDEAQYVVAELIRIHFAAQLIGDVPELSLQMLFLCFCHCLPPEYFLASYRAGYRSSNSNSQPS